MVGRMVVIGRCPARWLAALAATIALAAPLATEAGQPGYEPRDGYVLQFSWDNRAETFIGIGQIGPHKNIAREFYGLFQFAIWRNDCLIFWGPAQIAAVNKVGEFYGLLQLGAWNQQREQFVGLMQLGAYNEARRELYAIAQIGAYNVVHRAYVGLLMLGVVNHTWDGDILGPIQIGAVNMADYDIYSFVGQIGLWNAVDNKFWGPFQIGAYNYANRFAGLAQVGAFNHVYDEISLMQIGIVNMANRIDGVQIGIVNHALTMRGAQIGLVNLSGDGGLPFMPIFNLGI
jgi:hypothetical protein